MTPTVSTQSDHCTCQCSAYHEDAHDHGDIRTAYGTAVERGHSVRTTLAKASVSAWYYSADPSRGATRQTSQQSAGSSAAAAAGYGAVEVVAVDVVDCSSSSSLLSLSMAMATTLPCGRRPND